MHTEIQEITPQYAEVLLKNNTQNRILYKSRVMSYAKDMKNGDWKATHQGIAFYEDGTLADGQHRLWAVVESNCTVPMVVTWGLPKETSVAIDCGKIRSIADGCKISGTHDWINNRKIACSNYLFFGRSNANQIVSRPDSIKHAETIKDHLNEIHAMFAGNGKISKACVTAAFVSARISGVKDSVLYRISEVLKTGVPLNESEHIIVRLRDMILAARTIDMGKRFDIYKRTQRAIRAVEKNERLTVLMPQSEEIYKID